MEGGELRKLVQKKSKKVKVDNILFKGWCVVAVHLWWCPAGVLRDVGCVLGVFCGVFLKVCRVVLCRFLGGFCWFLGCF